MKMENNGVTEDQETQALNEELARMYEETITEIKEGEIVKGTIVHIGEKDVLVDIGYKSEGSIMKSEISDPEELKVGDSLDVMIEAKENDYGMVVLSHEKAKKLKSWQDIIENNKEGDVVTGKVSKKVRGGFMVDVGPQAFLPASLSMMQEFGNPDNLVGKKLEFKIVKINIPRKNIVVSRKEIVEEKKKGEKQALLETLNKGDIVKGVVKNITDFGAFIDIGGGITGLLHITDMSWGRVNNPNEVVKVGDEVDIKVLDFDRENIKVSLGLKQITSNPWEDIDQKYPEGGVVKGQVVNIMPYGVFIELEKGIEGLIHISEFSWSKKFGHPSEKFKVGDQVEAVVLKTDKDSQKLSLGIKQLEQDPWEGVEEKYSIGDKVKGTISTVTDYGAFAELEMGIEGLIHVSDLSWTKRITSPKEILKKGDDVEAMILNIDPQNRRIALGVKQLTPDPWDEIITKYKPDTVCDGTITNVTNFGLFVELEKDLEGLLHVSETGLTPEEKLEENFKVGDTVKVKVIHIDGVQKKIALSMKGFEGEKVSAEAKPEETKPEEVKADEAAPVAEEVPAEAKEEPKQEEVTPQEEASPAEAKEEPKQEEVKSEEEVALAEETAPAEEAPKAEEAKPEETKAEEAPADKTPAEEKPQE